MSAEIHAPVSAEIHAPVSADIDAPRGKWFRAPAIALLFAAPSAA